MASDFHEVRFPLDVSLQSRGGPVRLTGFRFRDRTDWRFGPPSKEPTSLDQRIAAWEGAARAFQLVKAYGASFAPYHCPIAKPVGGSARVALDWVEQDVGSSFICDPTTGTVTFTAACPQARSSPRAMPSTCPSASTRTNATSTSPPSRTRSR